MRGVWKRFGRATTLTEPPVSDIFASVQQELRNTVAIPKRRWRRNPDFSFLEPAIEDAKRVAADSGGELSGAQAWAWLYVLALQAPRAAIAQQMMDKHPHGYHTRELRVYELIDFNDAFVSTVLALPDQELALFPERAKTLLDWFCKRVGARSFSEGQYEAIVQGLGREIAVYRGAIRQGFEAHMTNRTADALGIDMVIRDPLIDKQVNIDCKAPSSYRHRIYDLLREGRLVESEVTRAEMTGYTASSNGHGQERALVVLLRIDRDEYGGIESFTLDNETLLGAKLHEIIRLYGT